MTRYQVVPDFQPAQSVPHDEPFTAASTLRAVPRASRVATEAPVDAPVRRFTSVHAGTMVAAPGAGAAGGTAGSTTGAGAGAGAGAGVIAGPPSANRQAKYVFVVPGVIADAQPKRWYAASWEVRCGVEPMKLRWAMATVVGVVVVPPVQLPPARSQPSW